MDKFTVTVTDPETGKTESITMNKVPDNCADAPIQELFQSLAKNRKNKAEKEYGTANLQPFTVVLKATSYKEVPVNAVSSDAAQELVREMYFRSDAIEFTDDDVTSIESFVDGEDYGDGVAPEFLPLLQMVRIIRYTNAPDEELAEILDKVITVVFSSDD